MLPDFSFVLVKAAFEVMKKGEKLEEFRDNTEYWRARLMEAHDKFRQFKHLHFINGRRKDSRQFTARYVSTCFVDFVHKQYSNGFVLHKPYRRNGYFRITFELME